MTEMYSWGANSYGQLCLSHTDDVLTPTRVPESSPVDAAAGGGHTFLRTATGEWYGCGSDSSGQLGIAGGATQHGAAGAYQTQPNRICFPEHSSIATVRCGWDFSFIITRGGEVYGFGSNAFGQLGLGDIKRTPTPVRVEGLPGRVVDAACGLRHSLLLTKCGHVLASGAARRGQLGLPAITLQRSVFTPVEAAGLEKVVQVAAGEYHSAALTAGGRVWVWGDNRHGQLTDRGTTTAPPAALLQQLFAHQPVTQLRSGWAHLLAQTESGCVYSWGRHHYGQLGRSVEDREQSSSPAPVQLPGPPEQSSSPAPVQLPGPPEQLAVGAQHNLALIGGLVYAWGWGEHGVCGGGDEADVHLPRALSALPARPLRLVCGAGHSIVLAAPT